MTYMFANATAFNQQIGNWNTARVTSIDYMFNLASAFHGQLCWNLQSLPNATFVLDGSAGCFYQACVNNMKVSRSLRFCPTPPPISTPMPSLPPTLRPTLSARLKVGPAPTSSPTSGPPTAPSSSPSILKTAVPSVKPHNRHRRPSSNNIRVSHPVHARHRPRARRGLL